MTRQAFILLNFLYLACTLATIQAETYNGPGPIVIGQPWSIICQGGPDDNFQSSLGWTRNSQNIPELPKAEITVKYDHNNNTSTLSSSSATEAHDGIYRCLMKNSKEFFELTVIQDFNPKIKLPKIPLSIKCENITGNPDVTWKMEGKVINNQKIFTIDAQNSTLTIKLAEEDNSIFNKLITCTPGNSTEPASKFKIFPKPKATLPTHSVAVEGEKFTLHCTNKNNFYPTIKIKWQFENNDINNTSHVTYKVDEHNIENAILVIEKPTKNDAGDWTCRAAYDKNNLTDVDIDIAKTTLRVKDKLAALWPFLGICAEVFILCAIILIYEKKRNKADLEESDTDQSPDTKPASNKDSDVRHRK